jgi:hypothetical protein
VTACRRGGVSAFDVYDDEYDPSDAIRFDRQRSKIEDQNEHDNDGGGGEAPFRLAN